MTNKKFLPLTLLTLSFLSAAGCVTLAEKQAMQNDIAALQAEQQIYSKRLQSSSEEINETTSASLKTVAELNDSFGSLRDKLGQMEAKIDENKHLMETHKQETDKMLQDMDMRFKELEERLSKQASRAPIPEKKSEKTASAPSKKKAPVTEKDSYEAAIAPLTSEGKEKPTAEELTDSEKQLHKFMSKYPNSKLIPNAHYWLGEVHYQRGDYKEAIIEFDEVTRKGENSTKLKSAYLKQAYSFLALKDEKTAKMLLQFVTKKFPKTTEAKLAQEKLQTLEKHHSPS